MSICQIYDLCAETLWLGRYGENGARDIAIDVGKWFADLGTEGTVVLVNWRPGEDDTPYNPNIAMDGSKAVWSPSSIDLAISGRGFAELRYYVGNALAKSKTFRTVIDRTPSEGANPPSAADDWVERMEDAAVTTQTASETAVSAAETATEGAQAVAEALPTVTQAAQTATSAATTATNAATEAAASEEVASAAANAAQTASETATAASQTAVSSASTATTKAAQAVEAAGTATTKASEATQAATTATANAQTSTTKAEEATTAAATATSKATEATTAASTASAAATTATSAASTATSAASTATAAKTAAQTAQTGAETAQTAAETAAASVSASAAQIATNTADISAIKTDLSQLSDYVIDEIPTELPNILKGIYDISGASESNIVISGTHNVAQLYGIKQGTFVVNGVTIVVDGTTVTVTGQPTADFYYSYVDGEPKTALQLADMVLPLPEHLYTASHKVLSGTVFPPVLCRGKASGNVFNTQNNAIVFTMDKLTCGGLYSYMQASKTYDCTFIIGLIPYSTNNGNPYRDQISSVTVIQNDGAYELDGYTWGIGNPTVIEMRSKLPKKPKCKYSTRSIDYSSMQECLDVYIPAKNGYIDYAFGRTQNDIAQSEGGGNVWRLVQVFSVNDGLAEQFRITQLGETEMAIGIQGRDDFIGGSTHGDEVMDASSLLFVLDGKPVDVTTLTDLTEFDTLQCFLVSDMYDPADHTTIVGKHGREWRFDASGLYIGQTIEFLTDLILVNSYAPMLCVLRGNDSASALQVTDTYVDDGNYQQYDVSVGGFTTYPNQLKSDVREIHLIGETSGVEATLKIIEQPEGLRSEGVFLFNGVNTYNKIYCCLCGYGGGPNTQDVTSGTKWKVKSHISFDVG